METLCSNFDLGSSISKSFTSKSLFSCRFSSIRFRRRIVPQAFGRKELPIAHLKKEEGENENLVKWVGKGVIGLAAALSLSCHSLALAESLTVAFPVSHTPEVRNQFLFHKTLKIKLLNVCLVGKYSSEDLN